MTLYGINSQWSKKKALLPLLPEEIIDECKPILRLSKADAGSHIYKDLKAEILQLYGPREEDAFKKAMALRLTGKPSALGKKLIHIWCPGAKPFNNCHCSKVVYGFWESQLTLPIKNKLAGKKFNKDTYSDLFKLADEVWMSNGGQVTSPPAVVAAVAAPVAPDTPQVAAVGRGGRGGRDRGTPARGRGGRGRGSNQNSSTYNTNQNNTQRQQSSGNKPHQKGPKAAPDVPDNACARHWREGRNATYCSDPLVCDWVKVIAPRTPRP